ncbi:MAG: cobalamin B12-binding domain-containing protein [Elusimicrobia bacterium]|nr:cobalamin B12-binding domain-containing protein [Elusimicrobiota bacterium]
MKILLVNPPQKSVYTDSKVKEAVPFSPPLNLAVVSPALRQNHEIKIFDGNIFDEVYRKLKDEITGFSPDYVGITFTTPLYDEMRKISDMAKEINPRITTVGGGAHASAMPVDTLRDSSLDMVVACEGDFALSEIVGGKPLESISGVFYKKDGKIRGNPPREQIKNLDALPFPAWDLFEIKKYSSGELLSKKTPAGWLETSRGCVFRCAYCNKSVVTGIRINGVDRELLDLMRKAGCYRVYYGIESGNQKVLDAIQKGITLDQVRKTVEMTREAGLEVFGFFMIALPGETEASMTDTINFAKELDLDMAKMSVTVPLPATRLYETLESKGRIKTNVWSKYNLYSIPEDIYDPPGLTWDIVKKYYRRFYVEFYFRPSFIVKYAVKSLKQGSLLQDIKRLVNTRW